MCSSDLGHMLQDPSQVSASAGSKGLHHLGLCVGSNNNKKCSLKWIKPKRHDCSHKMVKLRSRVDINIGLTQWLKNVTKDLFSFFHLSVFHDVIFILRPTSYLVFGGHAESPSITYSSLKSREREKQAFLSQQSKATPRLTRMGHVSTHQQMAAAQGQNLLTGFGPTGPMSACSCSTLCPQHKGSQGRSGRCPLGHRALSGKQRGR